MEAECLGYMVTFDFGLIYFISKIEMIGISFCKIAFLIMLTILK